MIGLPIQLTVTRFVIVVAVIPVLCLALLLHLFWHNVSHFWQRARYSLDLYGQGERPNREDTSHSTRAWVSNAVPRSTLFLLAELVGDRTLMTLRRRNVTTSEIAEVESEWQPAGISAIEQHDIPADDPRNSTQDKPPEYANGAVGFEILEVEEDSEDPPSSDSACAKEPGAEDSHYAAFRESTEVEHQTVSYDIQLELRAVDKQKTVPWTNPYTTRTPRSAREIEELIAHERSRMYQVVLNKLVVRYGICEGLVFGAQMERGRDIDPFVVLTYQGTDESIIHVAIELKVAATHEWLSHPRDLLLVRATQKYEEVCVPTAIVNELRLAIPHYLFPCEMFSINVRKRAKWYRILTDWQVKTLGRPIGLFSQPSVEVLKTRVSDVLGPRSPGRQRAPPVVPTKMSQSPSTAARDWIPDRQWDVVAR